MITTEVVKNTVKQFVFLFIDANSNSDGRNISSRKKEQKPLSTQQIQLLKFV